MGVLFWQIIMEPREEWVQVTSHGGSTARESTPGTRIPPAMQANRCCFVVGPFE